MLHSLQQRWTSFQPPEQCKRSRTPTRVHWRLATLRPTCHRFTHSLTSTRRESTHNRLSEVCPVLYNGRATLCSMNKSGVTNMFHMTTWLDFPAYLRPRAGSSGAARCLRLRCALGHVHTDADSDIYPLAGVNSRSDCYSCGHTYAGTKGHTDSDAHTATHSRRRDDDGDDRDDDGDDDGTTTGTMTETTTGTMTEDDDGDDDRTMTETTTDDDDRDDDRDDDGDDDRDDDGDDDRDDDRDDDDGDDDRDDDGDDDRDDDGGRRWRR